MAEATKKKASGAARRARRKSQGAPPDGFSQHGNPRVMARTPGQPRKVRTFKVMRDQAPPRRYWVGAQLDGGQILEHDRIRFEEFDDAAEHMRALEAKQRPAGETEGDEKPVDPGLRRLAALLREGMDD